MAERGGFEPPVPALDQYRGLANRCFQPLSHLSFMDFSRILMFALAVCFAFAYIPLCCCNERQTMKLTTHVKVRERHTVVKGKSYRYWIVDQGLSGGRRVTKQFTSKTAAEQYAVKRRVEKRKYGELAFKLTDLQREDAARALAVLATHGSLTEAAKFYVARIAPGGGRRTVAEVDEGNVTQSSK